MSGPDTHVSGQTGRQRASEREIERKRARARERESERESARARWRETERERARARERERCVRACDGKALVLGGMCV